MSRQFLSVEVYQDGEIWTGLVPVDDIAFMRRPAGSDCWYVFLREEALKPFYGHAAFVAIDENVEALNIVGKFGANPTEVASAFARQQRAESGADGGVQGSA